MALADLARGQATQPLRHLMRLPRGSDIFGMMPAQVGGEISSHGIKAVSFFPGNHGTVFDAHQGVVVLFEPEHGCPVAVLDASEITAIRTGAASALATRLLAREDATTLGLLGAGVQAENHLAAITCVRRIESVRVWSRDAVQAERFAAEQGRPGMRVMAVTAAREAVVGSDIVCTVTAAGEPILKGTWLEPGTHINAVGACLPTRRELDSEAVQRARLFTDRMESLEHEAGDYLIGLREGVFDKSHALGEIGDILVGRLEGRRAAADITLFKSLGIGIEDLAAAWHVYRKALQQKGQQIGTWVEFGSAPDATT